MQHSQHVDLPIGGECIHDQIRQSDDRKLSRSADLPRTTQKRKLPEHHRRLDDAHNHSFRGSGVIFGDPIADSAKVIARLRREVNDQSSGRVAPVRPGSSTTDPAPASGHARSSRASSFHSHGRPYRDRLPASRTLRRAWPWVDHSAISAFG